MANILLDDGSSISIQFLMTERFLWQERRQNQKHSRWRMTFDDGNLSLIERRSFSIVKILKRLESNSDKDIIKKLI
jgi:hypothetical protein